MKKIMRICFAVLISILLVIPSSSASIHAEDTGGDILEGTSSDYIIVEDQSTGNVIASKNADKKMFPASMTKMMSIILAIENLTDLNQTITITNEMLSGLYEANASVAGFASGDQPTVLDLLYGAALPSGADAINAIAYTVSGSIDSFVALMNEKAQQIGMSSTHFTNPTGLHDDDHYSTARDIAALLKYCLSNDTFKTVLSAASYTSTTGISMTSTFSKGMNSSGVAINGFIGGKTGYTGEAKHCGASFDEVNGMSLIVVTAHGGSTNDIPAQIYDLNQILTTLQNYSSTSIVNKGDTISTVTLSHVIGDESYPIIADSDVSAVIPNDSSPEVTLSGLPDNPEAELDEQNYKCTLSVTVNGTVISTSEMTVSIPAESNVLYRLLLHARYFFTGK